MDRNTTNKKRVYNAEDLVTLLESAPNEALDGSFTEQDLDIQDIKNILQYLLTHWTVVPSDYPYTNLLTLAAEKFGKKEDFIMEELVPFGLSGLDMIYTKKLFCMVRIRYHLLRLGLIDEENTNDFSGNTFRIMLVRIHEGLKRFYDILMNTLLIHRFIDSHWASDCPTEPDPYHIKALNYRDLEKKDVLKLFVLDKLQMKDLRKFHSMCYIQIDSPPILIDNKQRTYKTHAWKPYMEIREFINNCAPKETHYEMWKLAGKFRDDVARDLEEMPELEFPVLKPDRHWHAFANGIYNTNWKTFYPWGHKMITVDVTACKYHDAEFPIEVMDIPEWQDIPTPFFEKILQTQLRHVVHTETDSFGTPKRYTAEEAEEENAIRAENNDLTRVSEGDKILINEGLRVIEWVYIFLGRLLYEVNEKDTWQVLPMFIGRAGTGKSLILSTVAKFFDEADVAIVANDQQKGFGLSTVHDKKLWMVKEVKHDFAIDQAQLQSMISGEEMSIQIKFKDPKTVVWRAPGILAGNELANWTDNSGSMSRRLVLFYFNKKVHNSDPRLAEELARELPKLLHKCNRAYLKAVFNYGHCDLWAHNPHLIRTLQENPDVVYRGSRTILPSYFHVNKSSMKQQTHLMENFLANRDEVEIVGSKSGIGMPFEFDQDGRPSFKTIANAYFKKQDVKGGFSWAKQDRYRATFDDYEIEERHLTEDDVRNGRNVYMGHPYPVNTNWVFGVVQKSAINLNNLE